MHLLNRVSFDESTESINVPAIQPLAITEGMHAFVADDIAEVKNKRLRIHRLIRKLAIHGYYTESYDSSLTQTASTTFAKGRGNCLSHTHLFIALAREAGLDARYELVEAPSLFSADRGVLEHQMHIRTRIIVPRRVEHKQYISVDFNVTPTTHYKGRLISDKFAESLHYANDSVAHWHNGDDATAFSLIAKAIRLEPKHPDHWTNLATYYARLGKHDEALQINRYALSLNPRHQVALAGVAANSDGEEQSSAIRLLDRRRAKNPYYQLALAQRAHHHEHYEEALVYVDKSIELDRSNADSLAFRGDILVKLGAYEDARESYSKAIRYAKTPSQELVLRDALERVSSSTPENT